MSPITQIRDYLKLVIREVDSEFKSHDEVFVSENISSNNLDNTYFMEFGEMSSLLIDSTIESSVPVSISIFKHGYNKLIENFDNTYCKAIEIQAKAMNQTRIDQTEFIKQVVGNSISPEPLTTDDNSMRFTIQFNILITYKD